MADTTELAKYRILEIGLDPLCQGLVQSFLDPNQRLTEPYDLNALVTKRYEHTPVALLLGTPPLGVTLREAAQVARMTYPDHPIFYVTSTRTDFNRREFQKNGFTDAFLVPIDTDVLIQTIREELSKATKGLVRSYRPVRVVDLTPNETLDFDTYMYLPVNRKHLRISIAGDEIDERQFEKLTKSLINSVHVTADQMKNFYEYAGRKLRRLQKGQGISETERKERMTGAIRNLVSSMFNDSSTEATIDSGRSIVTDCQQIVRSFIVSESSSSNEWYEKMLQVTGAESGSYNHSGNVATFGALFSLASGIGKPEDIALAGLLHDLGKADLPVAIQSKEESQFTREEAREYRRHVDNTLSIIKFRKMILPDSVIKGIAQHHERWSGTGYPKGMAGDRISKEAQLLALADRFDYLTMTRDGYPRMKPADAFTQIYEENLNDPQEAQFDLELLKTFLSIFPEEAA